MNSKSYDIDFIKISNEMYNNLASPKKLTTIEKISQFSKDILFEGKVKEPVIPNKYSNTGFFKLVHSNSINDNIKNKFAHFYNNFIHKKNKISENNIAISAVKSSIERVIINNKVEKLNNSSSIKNQLLLSKRKFIYNLVSDIKKGKSRNNINKKILQKNLSVPHINNNLSPNSFLQNQGSIKNSFSGEQFGNWDKVRKSLIFTSPRKLHNSNSQTSLKKNLFLNSTNRLYNNLFNSTSSSLKYTKYIN